MAWAWLLAAVPLSAACSGGLGGGAGEPRQVLVLLLDGVRADRLSCYGYGRETTPALDSLARAGTLFRSVRSTATTTRDAIPGLLYSRYFSPPAFPFGDEEPFVRPHELFRSFDAESLAFPKVFAAEGFVTAGMSTHNWTKATTRLAREFGEWHDLYEFLPREEGAPFPAAEEAVDYALRWMEDYRERDFLLWLHLVDTTFPLSFGEDAARFLGSDPPDLERFGEGGVVEDPSRPLEEPERAYLDALYDGGLRRTDRALARLFAELKGSALLEEGLVVVVSDHGQGLMDSAAGFGEGGRWYEAVSRVPMILGGGRAPVGELDAPASLVDLYPTLLALMDLEVPEGVRVDGVDLTSVLDGSRRARESVAASGAIVHDGWKAFFHGGSQWILGENIERNPGRIAGVLVNLEQDAREATNLRSTQPARWTRMVELYRELLAEPCRRHLASATSRTPTGPFAIGAMSFEFDREVPRGPQDLRGALRPRRDPEGWIASPRWPHFYLLGHGDAGPLEVSFPIPDGVYEVELSMTGSCRVFLPGERRPRLGRARRFSPRRPSGAVPVPIGAFEVSGGRFQARFEMDPDSSYFYLRSIGFQSAGPGGSAVDGD